MKTTNAVLALAAALCALLTTESAFAWHHHHRARVGIGLYFGAPLAGWGYRYAPPYYYYPPYTPPTTVVVPAQPQTYIEQAPAVPTAPAQNYWYYCPDSRAYYPYVKDCPAGWQRVSPRPQG